MGSGQGKKPSLFGKCKEVFLKLDLFSNPQFLKYKGEGSYQTYTGSTLSVLIMILFTVAFFNFCKQTINREKITSTPKTRPSSGTSFNTNQSNSVYMFGVGIEDIDLATQQKLFDFFMSSRVYKNGVETSSQRVPLEPCLPEQWEDINNQFKNTFSRLNFQQRLCPPKNHNFTFKGKYTSQEFHYTKLVVRRCQSDTVGACATDQEFAEALQKHNTFKLSIYFANPVIDASQKQYLDYVLEDTNYFEFSDSVGVSSHIFFSEYEVNTDRSVYPEPFSDVTTERGLTLNERPVVSNFEIINTDELVRIYLRKSDLIQQFDRSYTRFDATFAYLGGLFGMVLMLFYGMRAFSEYAFEFEIGSHLFVYDDSDRSEFQTKQFHILRFPLYLLYCIVTFFYEPAQKWSCFNFECKVDKCREEVRQQTDVCFLIKRVIYIEKAIELFLHDKLNQLNIDHKWTISEARQKRNFYNQSTGNRENIKELILTSEKKAAEQRKLSMAKEKPAEQEPQIIIQMEDEVQRRIEQPSRAEGGYEIHTVPNLDPEECDENIVENEIQIEIDSRRSGMISHSEQASNAQLNRNALRNRDHTNMERQSPQGAAAKSESQKSNSNGSKDELQNKENAYVSFFNVDRSKRSHRRKRQKDIQ